VHVDLDRVIQVVVTCLERVEAAPPRSEVTLAARARRRFRGSVVTDRGRGIAPDKIGLLFQKFQQLDGQHAAGPAAPGSASQSSRRSVEMQGEGLRGRARWAAARHSP